MSSAWQEKQQPQESPQAQPKEHPEYVILLDCESLDGKKWLSEAYLLACRYNPEYQCYQIVEDLHLYAAVDKKVVLQEKEKCRWIYQNITGISFASLSHHGLPYKQVISQVHKFIGKYPTAHVLAREPALDQKLLQLTDVKEILNYLQEPYSWMYYKRRHRPVDVSNYCQKEFQCALHDHVLVGEPHCAKVDVFIMFCWLQSVGLFRLNFVPPPQYRYEAPRYASPQQPRQWHPPRPQPSQPTYAPSRRPILQQQQQQQEAKKVEHPPLSRAKGFVENSEKL